MEVHIRCWEWLAGDYQVKQVTSSFRAELVHTPHFLGIVGRQYLTDSATAMNCHNVLGEPGRQPMSAALHDAGTVEKISWIQI
jgi:hypothetical protein